MFYSIIFCDECFEILEKKGSLMISIYRESAESYFFYLRCKKIRPGNGLSEVLKYLEQLECIITTEDGEHDLLVKPLGITCSTPDNTCSTKDNPYQAYACPGLCKKAG